MSWCEVGDTRQGTQAPTPERLRHEHRREVKELTAERDSALAVIATLSTRLASVSRSLKASEFRANQAQARLNRVCAEQRASTSGVDTEVKATPKGADGEQGAISVVVNTVHDASTFLVSEDVGQHGVGVEVTQPSEPINGPRHPSGDFLAVDEPGEHEGLVQSENHGHLNERLVVEPERGVSDDELAAEFGHEDPSRSGGDQATPTDDEVA